MTRILCSSPPTQLKKWVASRSQEGVRHGRIRILTLGFPSMFEVVTPQVEAPGGSPA